MPRPVVGAKLVEMGTRIVIEIDGQASDQSEMPEPLQGWVCPDGEPKQRFVGYIELISHIETLRDLVAGPSPAGDEDGATHVEGTLERRDR